MILKKKKKINPTKIKREIPLVSDKQLKETREKINRQNRDRSKSHERRVAVILHGDRVPMSGAHKGFKGDVIIPLIYNPGRYIIECKMSATITDYGVPKLNFLMSWFIKLKDEVRSMNAQLGVFVLHYHNNNILKDYVLIHEDDVTKILTRYPSALTDEVVTLYDKATIIDIRTMQNGRTLKAYRFVKNIVERDMIDINGIKGVKYLTNDGIYLLMYLQDFRTVMECA